MTALVEPNLRIIIEVRFYNCLYLFLTSHSWCLLMISVCPELLLFQQLVNMHYCKIW